MSKIFPSLNEKYDEAIKYNWLESGIAAKFKLYKNLIYCKNKNGMNQSTNCSMILVLLVNIANDN